jgi:hypothetical protein
MGRGMASGEQVGADEEQRFRGFGEEMVEIQKRSHSAQASQQATQSSLGAMMRARGTVYGASVKARQAAPEPKSVLAPG